MDVKLDIQPQYNHPVLEGKLELFHFMYLVE